MRYNFTYEQLQEMKSRYEAGETQEAIGITMGCDKLTVSRYLNKLDIKGRNQKIQFTDEEKQDIINEYQNGLTISDVARKFQYSPQTITRGLTEWGIEIRPRIKTRKPGEDNKRELTEEQKQHIISEFNSGRTIKSIAEEYSIWVGIIRKLLVANGLETRKYVKGTPEQIETIIRLYKEGADLDDFKEILGINRYWATKLLRDNGVEIRKQGKQVQYNITDDLKQCGRCQKYKNISEFQKCSRGVTGLQSLCRICSKESCQTARRRKLFQLDPEGYDKLHKEQNGLCAICGQPERRERLGVPIQLAIDHNHTTGKIRQLLCANCNQMIGLSYDNPEVLLSAAMYLERHKENQNAN